MNSPDGSKVHAELERSPLTGKDRVRSDRPGPVPVRSRALRVRSRTFISDKQPYISFSAAPDECRGSLLVLDIYPQTTISFLGRGGSDFTRMKRFKMKGLMRSIICFAVLFKLFSFNLSASLQEIGMQNIKLEKDVVYAEVDGLQLKLDIAYPDILLEPAPAIVDIPGGSWRFVRKSIEDAIWYAKLGFIGVSTTHRTSDIAVFPAAVHDCKTVIRWLRANAKKYHINPDKIGVTGFSSGGHIAVLLGTSGGTNTLKGMAAIRNTPAESRRSLTISDRPIS